MSGIVQAKLVGGFGNQLHQYVSARKYAEIVGATLEVPDWVGKVIFGLSEPEWSRDLPEVNDGANGCPPELDWGQTNVRLGGYFMTARWVGILSKRELRRWLQVTSAFEAQCAAVVPAGKYTAAHLRQGDYLGHPLYANVPRSAYRRASEKFGFLIDHWAEQDHPRKVSGLGDRYHFLPDFLVLLRASVLFRANSTFSWWAGALGDAVVYAPVVDDHVGEYDAEFVCGNWPRVAHTRRVGPCVEDLHLPE